MPISSSVFPGANRPLAIWPMLRSDACATYASALGTLLSLSSACLLAQREVEDRLRDLTPSPWTSREACEEQTPPLVSADHPPRIGTWNLLYFPDADEDQEEGGDGTDIDWLACTIAGLKVDLLAVQEIKTTDRSTDMQAERCAQPRGRVQPPAANFRLAVRVADLAHALALAA